MKTLKVMSIISFVITGFSLLCIIAFNNAYDYEAAVGWGLMLALWSIAFSIVALVQSLKK